MRSILLVLITLAGCAASTDAQVPRDEHADPPYGELFDILDDSDGERWDSAMTALVSDFERKCGDTSCAGDYSNIRHVALVCSATRDTPQTMKACAWVFGASRQHVDGLTGELRNEARVITCEIPVAGTVEEMLDTLVAAGARPLEAPLVGTGKSFYDGLVDCFAGVVAPPLPAPPKMARHAELGEWLWQTSESRGQAWSEMKRRLAVAFDQLCGDTLCEGAYGAWSSVSFVCAVDTATEYVSRCIWSLAGADIRVDDTTGAIEADTTTKTCTIQIAAQASDLAVALDSPELLDAKLPGRTTSIWDAFVYCGG